MNLFDISEYDYFDQYTDMKTVYAKKDYIEHFRSVITAINKSKFVNIIYSTLTGKCFSGVYALQNLEYSKRDDKFRVYAIDKNDHVYILNIERICAIELLNDTFDNAKISKTLSDYYENNKSHIIIQFTDRKNVPDRILSEFSPWKKECIKDAANNIYTLDLEYDRSDKLEIVVRLLSYGPYILIVDDNGGVKEELIERLKEQVELIKNRNLDKLRKGDFEHDE